MRPEGSRLALERPAAVVVTGVALLLFLNGSLLSAWGALHVDLSINLTAAHALRDGADPYGVTALRERAASLGSPTNLIYGQLFPSYIQPPTSALSLLPLTLLDWRDATRVYLVLNHVFLLAAVALTLSTLRPSLPLRWLIAGAAGIVAAHAQINASLLLVSLAYAGADVYESYRTETLPALAKGSTHYSNASFGALIARAHTPAVIGGLPEMLSRGEGPASGW